MYLKYWGFKRPPFNNIPDPDFFYMSGPHLEALTRLIYAYRMRKNCTVLAGHIGCGKTLVSRVFVRRMSSDKNTDIVRISNPCGNAAEFLQDVFYKLAAGEGRTGRADILHILNERLLQNAGEGKDTTLIIDEAQVLTDDALEEVRLLLNFQTDDKSLLTVVLLGQPQLISRLNRLTSLRKRIGVSYFLRPLSLKETAGYIFFRQKKAGATKNVFSKQAIEMIYSQSNGLAGSINNLCDLSLFAAFGQKEPKVNVHIVKDVIRDGAFS